MKAVEYDRYGSPEVLQQRNVEKPVPKDDEILVKIRATSVTSGDIRVRSLDVPAGFKLLSRMMFGITKPRNSILGIEFAGEVEAVGKNVTQFAIGDEIFGAAGSGSYAEYATVPEDEAVTHKPTNLSFDEAAAVPFGALSSLVYLRDLGKIKKGQRILVNGASGGLGSYAVQLGKYFGAKVTGVCSTSNLEWVKSIGADRVIDYTKEDFADQDETYDIIFDTVGKIFYTDCKKSLKDDGRFLMAVAGIPQFLLMLWTSMRSKKKAIAGVAEFTKEDLNVVKELIEKGLVKPIIDRRYPLEEIVEAHRYVDGGHKKGNVVITLENQVST